jgi:hypothetical protein
MKNLHLIAMGLLLIPAISFTQSVGINIDGSAPDNSAILDVKHTGKGVLIPRMTAAERAVIDNPANGLIVYQTDDVSGIYINAGTSASPNWLQMTTSASGIWDRNGTDIYYASGQVGIGTSTPSYHLAVADLTGNCSVSIASQAGAVSRIFLGSTATPEAGRISYNTSNNALSFFTNSLTRVTILGGGAVGIGNTNPISLLHVEGNVLIPAINSYRYATPKIKKYKIGVADMQSANPALYQPRIDDGFSSANNSGLNLMSATGGTAGNVAYFIAPVHLPDSAVITSLAAQLVKNGGSLQSVVELYRTDGTGYFSNTAQLIATATTTGSGGGIAYLTAPSVNALYNTVDNSFYYYFIRYSGEQATQNLRFANATITYQVYRSEY